MRSKAMDTTAMNQAPFGIPKGAAVCRKSIFRQTVRGQRSPKAKQTEGVGVQRYVRPSVCAGSQNALRSKLFVKENVKFPFQKRSAKNRKPQIASLRFDGLGLF